MSDAVSNPLLALIKERGLIDDLQYEEVVQEQTRSGKPIAQILSDFALVDTFTQMQVMAEHLGTDTVEIREQDLTPEIIQTVPLATARMYECVPVAVFGSTVQMAFVDPLNPEAIDQVRFSIGGDKEIQVVVADPNQIRKALDKFYPQTGDSGLSDILKELGGDFDISKEVAEIAAVGFNVSNLESLANETPIIKFVNLVLFQAVQDRASDIHFEPFEDEFKIRYRVDGALYEMAPPPKHLAVPVTSRLKVMANLDISERRLPQDGRIAINLAGRQVDLRVSTLPTQFGESVCCVCSIVPR